MCMEGLIPRWFVETTYKSCKTGMADKLESWAEMFSGLLGNRKNIELNIKPVMEFWGGIWGLFYILLWTLYSAYSYLEEY